MPVIANANVTRKGNMFMDTLFVNCHYGYYMLDEEDVERISIPVDFFKLEYEIEEGNNEEDEEPKKTNATLTCGDSGRWVLENGKEQQEEDVEAICQRKFRSRVQGLYIFDV